MSKVDSRVLQPSIPSTKVLEKSDDEKIIERVLQRATLPKITYKITWEKFSVRQMEMLIDFLGIDPKLIIDYYIDKIDINKIKEELGEQILKYISTELNEYVASEEPKSKPKTTKKASK